MTVTPREVLFTFTEYAFERLRQIHKAFTTGTPRLFLYNETNKEYQYEPL